MRTKNMFEVALTVIAIFLFVFSAFTVALALTAEAQVISGVVTKVLDGDTIYIDEGDGIALKVRLYGVDCPEKKQSFGIVAKNYVSKEILNKTVNVIPFGKGRYKRTIGMVLSPAGRVINYDLVESGLCWWYKSYSKKDALLAFYSKQAKELQLGLFSEESPKAPWDYRKGR